MGSGDIALTSQGLGMRRAGTLATQPRCKGTGWGRYWGQLPRVASQTVASPGEAEAGVAMGRGLTCREQPGHR